ncbi:MAG: sodium:solute symporter family protein [Lachnospiraceae bacterium]|nr:sodium:solute symporter family protein [Lachnospiraceae bacterium]
MNVYLIGMIIAMVIFLIIGFVVSKKVQSAEDFYVAGRQAPVILIAGSLVASYSSTGMFMGDAGTCYDGGFSSLMILSGMLAAGYIFGSIFFGRYLRRSKALTMPEFFGQRFDSKAVRTLSAITAIITMTVYLLSVMQGIGTLMEVVTGVDYKICIIVAMVVFTLISVTSGSRGVLITDTLMAAVFTIALIIGVAFIAHGTGGWYDTIHHLAANTDTSALLSWAGKAGALYDTGAQNVTWGVIYGISWMSVCMVGPWQASRYQMAKSESVVVKSAYWSAIGVFLLQFLSGIGAVFVNRVFPDMPDSTHVLIWASMNLMPKILGIILLTGILAAGISSATTFQSLIGSMVANDVVKAFDSKGLDKNAMDKKAINIGRITMIAAAVVVTLVALGNPPAIFVIMYLGGAMIASSWMPVAVASVFSKRVTKTGAFAGMLAGFVTNFALKLISHFAGWSLPVWLDPVFVGIIVNIIALIIGSACTKVTEQEVLERNKMFIIPESEKDPKEIKKTMVAAKIGCLVGAVAFIVCLVLWIIPYLNGLNM